MRGPLRVAVTMGDAAGIGPEVALKALANAELGARVVLVGCPRVLSDQAALLGLRLPEVIVEVPWVHERLPTLGHGGRKTGEHALACLRKAVSLARTGQVDGIVTGPVSKEMLGLAGVEHPGQTELLAELTGAERFLMLLAAGTLRVAVVTTHLPLIRVASRITKETVLEKISVLYDGLRHLFGIPEPLVAVLGLNPHAGEGGRCGSEEQEHIAPAMREAAGRGISLEGPLPADGAFAMWRQRSWDAVLAMYHDQGLAPFKALSFGGGVNVTLGLPVIRTSPDHGTAYEIAGQGVAREGSMVEAIRLALRMAATRAGEGGAA